MFLIYNLVWRCSQRTTLPYAFDPLFPFDFRYDLVVVLVAAAQLSRSMGSSVIRKRTRGNALND